MIAEEDLICNECRHDIPAGTECLSQLPVDMPEEFSRDSYQSFCISCTECKLKKDEPPCYTRRLDHWYIVRKTTEESVRCGHCDRTIPEGTRTVVQKIYAWPDSEEESEATSISSKGTVTGASAGVGATRAGASRWHNLSPETRYMFRTRGLGGSRGIRTPAMAQRLYESLPRAVRNLGEGAVKDFVNGKHASHIQSVRNAPGRAKWPSNIVWEKPGKNVVRGSRNMTSAEVAAAESSSRVTATSVATKATLKSAAKRGGIAAAIELPIAALENSLHYKRGRKTGKEAAIDTTKSTAAAAGVGAAVAVGAKVAVGAGLSMGPFGTPVVVGGVAVLAGTTVYRIAKAAKRDIPLDEYYIFFCKKQNCKTEFSQSLTNSASVDSPYDIE